VLASQEYTPERRNPMGRKIVYKCDDNGCNQEWTPSNHWFQVGPMEDTFRAEGEPFPPGLEVIPFNPVHWSDDFPATDKVFCGVTHTLVYLSKELHKMHEPTVAPATMGADTQEANLQASESNIGPIEAPIAISSKEASIAQNIIDEFPMEAERALESSRLNAMTKEQIENKLKADLAERVRYAKE